MTRDSVIKTGLLGAAAAFFSSARPAGAVSGYDRTVRLWESPLFNTNDIAPALRAALKGPACVELPKSTTWIRGTVDVPSGASIEGSGAAGYLICTTTPFRMLPGNELGPSWIRGLRLHAAEGSDATRGPCFDSAGSLTDENQTIRGVHFSNIRPSGFGLGWRVTGYQRSRWSEIYAHGCQKALEIVGRTAVLDFDKVVFEAGGSTAVLIDAAPGNSAYMPENTQFDKCQFMNFDVGIDRRIALVTIFRGLDLDAIRQTAFQWSDDNGGITVDGGYVNVKSGGNAFYGQQGPSSDNDVTITRMHVYGEGAAHGVFVDRRNGVHVTHNRFSGFAYSDINFTGHCNDIEISWNKCLSTGSSSPYSIDARDLGIWKCEGNVRARPAWLPNGVTR